MLVLRNPVALLQHTLYETHYLLAAIMDKGFAFHRSVAQLWAEMARNLTETVVLPMDLEWYAIHLKESFDVIQATYGPRLQANGATLGKKRNKISCLLCLACHVCFAFLLLEHFKAAVDNFNATIVSYRRDVISTLDENE